MSSDLSLREAGLQDLEVVYALVCQLEEKQFPFVKFQSLFAANCGDENVRYYVAKSGGRVVAFGSVHISRLLHHCGEVAEIQELFVLPEARGKGIGTALVEAMAGWAKERDAVQLEVASNWRREETHEFYESIGFEFTHKKFVRPMR